MQRRHCVSTESLHRGRATRSDSGETANDMTINRILSARWFATHDGNSSALSTLTISQLENLQEHSEPIYEASQYDMLLV